ncbi:hypothetical protein [Gayadomonas joobiniege]|uniref:hypothetical protein n=1 Tax=Gayadomonas joobiniege TaxID=1234606 RepID=UPI00035F60DA|nr:hypothetical protein [Gayadomonas joobiniege]
MKFKNFYTALAKAYRHDLKSINRVIAMVNQPGVNVIDEPAYFAIYHPTFDYDGRLGLFIEFAASNGCAFIDGINYFEHLARSGDGRFVKFKTRRAGVLRAAKRLGFEVQSRHKNVFVLTKEVD